MKDNAITLFVYGKLRIESQHGNNDTFYLHTETDNAVQNFKFIRKGVLEIILVTNMNH